MRNRSAGSRSRGFFLNLEILLKLSQLQDRGVASKRLCWKYKSKGKDFVFRMKEVNARYVGERKIEDKDKEKSVLEIVKGLPSPGRITWKEKKRGKKKLEDVG